ncbi:MAG: DUF711 family protein [Planctomycetota bacterium]|jgi:uncharacterized protein (UPF0210 family)
MRISVEQVFETVQMTMDQHFDIRTVTLGINLKDCMDRDSKAFNKRVHDRIVKMGKRLNTFADELESKYGVPIINRRISITPASILRRFQQWSSLPKRSTRQRKKRASISSGDLAD